MLFVSINAIIRRMTIVVCCCQPTFCYTVPRPLRDCRMSMSPLCCARTPPLRWVPYLSKRRASDRTQRRDLPLLVTASGNSLETDRRAPKSRSARLFWSGSPGKNRQRLGTISLQVGLHRPNPHLRLSGLNHSKTSTNCQWRPRWENVRPSPSPYPLWREAHRQWHSPSLWLHVPRLLAPCSPLPSSTPLQLPLQQTLDAPSGTSLIRHCSSTTRNRRVSVSSSCPCSRGLLPTPPRCFRGPCRQREGGCTLIVPRHSLGCPGRVSVTVCQQTTKQFHYHPTNSQYKEVMNLIFN